MSNKHLKSIINYYGDNNQKIKTIEELIELQAEIIKCINGKVNLDALKAEIADVENMLEQIKIIYNIDNYEIEEIRLFKIKRTLNEIQNG